MIVIVIPARLKSTRLERKPLAMIGDYPMLWWTWKKAQKSKLANKVIIATDSTEIVDRMTSYGAECVMTPEDCKSGSDRIYQATKDSPEAEIIVNLQGDEPLMNLDTLDGSIETLLSNSDCEIATAVSPFKDVSDWENPNNVKAVFNQKNKAIYFSRSPLKNGLLHIGLYVYRKSSLEKFCKLSPSPLENAEQLEQLRAIENEIPIYVYKIHNTEMEHFGIDTQEDLTRAREILLSTK
ncbi:MAG: 3-deoxy-manno-octulosonate cytidylyltransferase [Candidatus Caenarcaniphilales bacterium]|nr:3-deoxy-manno-octulosonate cytidylyltransferase [Candidatus Caenarcaniphilales bacterium]